LNNRSHASASVKIPPTQTPSFLPLHPIKSIKPREKQEKKEWGKVSGYPSGNLHLGSLFHPFPSFVLIPLMPTYLEVGDGDWGDPPQRRSKWEWGWQAAFWSLVPGWLGFVGGLFPCWWWWMVAGESQEITWSAMRPHSHPSTQSGSETWLSPIHRTLNLIRRNSFNSRVGVLPSS